MGRTSDGAVGAVTLLSEATVLSAGRGKATTLAVLVDGVADPVNSGVVTDADVVGVNKDDLEILVGGILVNPVRVQNTHVSGIASGSLLGNRAKISDELELVDTGVSGLSVDNTAMVGALAATSADGNSEDRESLLGLVAELVGLIRASGASAAGDLVLLSVLPGSVVRSR
jgi:hypothetical protein